MLNIKNLSCGYSGKNIIKNISFDLNENENICIIGPNGCGKTTLLKAISNIIEYEGEVLLNKQDISIMSRKNIAKNIALVSQSGNLYFPYSVYDTVALGRYPYKKGLFEEVSKEEKDFILSCIEIVNLLDEKDKMISELSGGQLQRVFLARAFAQDPNILLLDEPTNHLDLQNQIKLLEYINIWKKKKSKSVISVLHDLNLVQNFAEKVIVIDNGKKVLEGFPKEVLSSNVITEIYGINIKDFMIKTLKMWL